MTDLPPGWEWTTLGEVGEWSGGATPSKSNSAFWNNGTIPWISPKDIRSPVISQSVDYITESALAGSPVRLVPPNSVVIVVRSGILERTIPSAVVPFATTLNQDLKALTPYPGISYKWVAHCLRAFEKNILSDCRKSGTTVASIDVARLMRLKIPLAPLTEQLRIVDSLDASLSHLDAVCDSIDAASQKIQPLEFSTIMEVVGEVETSAFPLELLLREPLANGRSVPTRIGGFPVLRLPALASGHIKLDERKDGDWTRDQAMPFLVKAGDYLISRGNGSLSLVGRGGAVMAGPGDVAFPDTMIRIRPNDNLLTLPYLALVWNLPIIRRQIEGKARTTAGIYKINQSAVAAIEIPLPSREDQVRVLRYVEILKAKIAAARGNALSARAQARGLRGVLLREAFMGRLVPQAHADEPASMLLERIKAERAAEPKVRRSRRAPTKPNHE